MASDLQSLHGLLYRLITASEGVAQRLRSETALGHLGIESVIREDARLGAVERVEIYATAYFYRLLDCLEEDYPATLAVLGAETFQRLIADYLAEFSPTEPSIFYTGRHLPDFIAQHQTGHEHPYLADLACLERMTIEVFHGRNAMPLDAATMQLISPDKWPTFVLQLHPAARFLDVNWKVTDVLRAITEKREWLIPAKERSRVIVFRQKAEVYFRELESAEERALERARHPVKLADICEEIATAILTNEPTKEIYRLLQRWISDGILVAAGG
jgi:hypothetical protein